MAVTGPDSDAMVGRCEDGNETPGNVLGMWKAVNDDDVDDDVASLGLGQCSPSTFDNTC